MKQEFKFRLNVSVGMGVSLPSLEWIGGWLRTFTRLWPVLLAVGRLLT